MHLLLFVTCFSFAYGGPPSPPTVNTVYQFPPTDFERLENIAVRSNGQILFNTVTGPKTYLIDPTVDSPTPILLNVYPGATSALGIAEVDDDIFAVVVGSYNITTRVGVPGSFSVWLLNLQGVSPVASKITDIPEALALNGMTALPFPNSGFVFIADSELGAVWLLNTATGNYEIAIQNSLLNSTATGTLGINGLHILDRHLFLTNSALGYYIKVGTVHPDGTYDFNIVATPFTSSLPGWGPEIYDDFAFDEDGTAYITAHPDSIVTVNSRGDQAPYVSGLAQPTSAAFGRGSRQQRCTLYITCAGGIIPPNFTPGSLNSVDICNNQNKK